MEKKQQLLKKHGVELLSEVALVEDTDSFKPFWYKVEQIMTATKISKEIVENALRDYQLFMEV